MGPRFRRGRDPSRGHEWDEREQTPWPIIEEAAKVGIYSFDFIANAFGDSTSLDMPIVNEELCWGDAGITLAIMGSTLAVAGIAANGTPEQLFSGPRSASARPTTSSSGPSACPRRTPGRT